MDTVGRFEGRVDDYDRWRPDYPAGTADVLARAGLAAASTVADVGCGTGKLARVLLDAGHRVIGVEPGVSMRAAAARALGARPRFRQVAGRAEATGLLPASVDAIVAAQAFHWFEPEATRAEWRRVLRPGGLVALIWNDRVLDGCPMLAAYERLLRAHAPEYEALERRGGGDESVHAFFAPSPVAEQRLRHVQRLPWEGVAGRARSASYVPREGPGHDALFAGLRAAFDEHAVDGTVELAHDTRVFTGRLPAR